ncbi:UDP-N-acetylmuramoyl-L-alanyl-D-glutamate--2,6-diaminopimelate ligase [Candidatus Beckwithbacteria bacterium CG10_big_fil_rev_8_21_14_0_10_34_10]|uniref:UDP-N-acetylmuramoyl-L-alanyl-D-glutamate--2, 6-diaminopimelate ligase n=1 Tax=Candidatus Beckwithbacteria bacterium CG10_big_fil_rev_8_21_14_0_10_34_10 TaxID=1974495 RepID=A0A2H0W922_9BACT|nr:MAG: UDP-N-acetylmuramoyl-L-alanyl-D-glutamate--2,6-diaminopimelate ligase [Candidatus Beckwithbacteria bacterium CG10_big_fil_rev_8_21_14_0_10_34_10]
MIKKLISFLKNLISQKVINTFYHLPMAFLAALYYRFPGKKLKIIGVTGTDGKTTTSTLIYEILKKANYKTALITTVSAKIGDQNLSTGLHVTSPDPWKLQKILKLILNKGYEYLVLEVTSHGLDQYRFLGIDFKISVLTNVSHEHLDYHKTKENYLKAKAKLFKKSGFSVLNIDDQSFEDFKSQSLGRIISYGLKKGDYNLLNYQFKTNLKGNFNLANCLAAISVGKILKIPNKNILRAVSNFKGVEGRMEEIYLGQNFKVMVDFAHTPNALENVLKTLRIDKKGRLIAVFGSAGLRDREKRPMMGKIACNLADKVVLTAEDPRTESLDKIIKEISSGCQDKNKLIIEKDRQKAINLAIKMAGRKDLVGIFGKGHEESMCFGTKEIPWSDKKAVTKALKERLKK